MNEPPNSVDKKKEKCWLAAIARGIVVCILTAALLSVAARFFLPQIVDAEAKQALASTLVAITVWIISVGLGGWQVLRHRPKS